ncbi:LOW QUALITY PROTEIN: SUN domain-containing protein 2-like [Gavia stellata]|uniref:LOW QUALITY PROTEIN: SUN domain-containing protein 2-like n=1 Tax=Gavia stellata TaxID=37040 RepID=UPI00289FAEDD|nr:LOW QUALITY PROTEIN: SUN domain-containing protein 2-like [Gavia stellata]
MAAGRDMERGAGSPRHNPALDRVLCKESFGVWLTGVYPVGQLGEESLWRTAAGWWAYISSHIQPLQQQVRSHLPGGDWKTRRPAGDELGEVLSETLTLPEKLRKLQEELYLLRWSLKDVAERAFQEALKQAKLPGFTGWAVQEIINQVLEKLEEKQVPMPDYALKSSGAAVVHSRTSPSFRNRKGKVFLYSLPVLDYLRSPDVILEPENHPGNCWPLAGSQGHVLIRLSVPIVPRAVTVDHVSGTMFHRDSISRAPKDFAVYGLKEEQEEQGTFLGRFTFLAMLNPTQTFQLKNELSGFVNYIKLQVLSNWGHPDYTCLYRFRVHGDPPEDGGKGSLSSGNKDWCEKKAGSTGSRAELQDGAGGACCEAEGGEEGEDPAAIRRLPPEVSCVVARCCENNPQELQQLEGLLTQTMREQWSELLEAVEERVKVKKLLRNKVQRLLERRQCLRQATALRLLLFLALLQILVLIVVLLKRDILNWVLPPKLAAAFGSRPARSRFF